MGWKTNALLVDAEYSGPLAELLSNVVGRTVTAIEDSSVDEALWPNGLFAGVYRGCTLIFDQCLPFQVVREGSREFTEFFSIFSTNRVAAVTLHSDVNGYGFTYYQGGRHIRSLMGSYAGVDTDEGTAIPAESRVLGKFIRQPHAKLGQVFLDEQGEEWDLSALGEDIVFELIADFVGERPDKSDDFLDAPMTRFREETWWSRVFGARKRK